MGELGVGDMTKAVYDPDLDGKLALAQLVDAVCSEAEADTKVATAVKGESSGLREEHGRESSGELPQATTTSLFDGASGTYFSVSFATAFTSTPVVLGSASDAFAERAYGQAGPSSTTEFSASFWHCQDAGVYTVHLSWEAIGP